MEGAYLEVILPTDPCVLKKSVCVRLAPIALMESPRIGMRVVHEPVKDSVGQLRILESRERGGGGLATTLVSGYSARLIVDVELLPRSPPPPVRRVRH